VRGYADTGAVLSLRDKYGKDEAKYEEDICRDKQPGPALGQQINPDRAPGDGLPATLIHLSQAFKAKESAR